MLPAGITSSGTFLITLSKGKCELMQDCLGLRKFDEIKGPTIWRKKGLPASSANFEEVHPPRYGRKNDLSAAIMAQKAVLNWRFAPLD